jgi:hypothetical protein
MNDARAVVGMDRLPWLTDEPKPPARANSSARELLGWAVAGFVMVAGISYWLGVETGRSGQDAITTSAETPRSTVKLPEPRAIAPEVPLPAVPEVRLAPDRIVAIPEPRAEKPVRPRRTSSTKRKLSPMRLDKSKLADTVTRQRARKQSTAVRTARPATAPRLWPATESKGAYGRVVRIGAFGSRQQAKLGWRRMQRVYPAVARLPATVVADRNSRGRRFYRFQIGTTSQAHSEVLCQRMQSIRFSCAVVGLPWKAKVER